MNNTITNNYNNLNNAINNNYNNTLTMLNSLQTQINNAASNQVSVLNICNSDEYLIKVGTNYYAVYMVSNNYGTHLGKLSLNVTYQTTDSYHKLFKLTSSGITCL
jgi:hypothetical protein